MKIGNVITLDADGERIIKAIAQGSWAHLTDREFKAYQKAVHDWNEGEVKPPRSGYHEALSLIRSGETSAAAIAVALGGDGQNGEEGNIWSLFDARHRTHRVYDYRRDPDLQSPLEGDDQWEVDDPSQPEEEVTASEGALCFVAQVSGRTIRRWVRNGAPVKARNRHGLIFDLNALADWMIEIERDSERHGTKTVGSLKVADLRGPRRRITMRISQRQQEARRFEAQQEARFVGSSRLAIEAAAVIEDAAAVVGWSEIEALTGLRHVPSAGVGRKEAAHADQ